MAAEQEVGQEAEVTVDLGNSYPVKDATDDELRRAWILELLCATPEGPIFDTLVSLACDIEAFLLHGTRPAKLRTAK